MESPQKYGVPKSRIRILSDQHPAEAGEFVVYWMTTARRAHWNFGLDRAVELALSLDRPLLVLEPLRVGYRWASERFHRFIVEGMLDNAGAFAGTNVNYFPYVEPAPGAGSGLLEALMERAAAMVADDYPGFFLPRMLEAAAARSTVRMEAVDSNGILPIHTPGRVFHRAYDFRRYLQKELSPFLFEAPASSPNLEELAPPITLPAELHKRWPMADLEQLLSDGIAELPIDHMVMPGPLVGGPQAAGQHLADFVANKLSDYGQDRNRPEGEGTSGLSSYLHFGHISTHEVLHSLAEHEGWSPWDLGDITSGKRTGWWNLSEPAEAFLDQIVTWRELGFNAACQQKTPGEEERIESLPPWAQLTLSEHRDDPRPYVYTIDQFERAETHDDLWNAAQNQLRKEGRIQNYLRMLWGKKILHWSESPETALAIMTELNNKYALDGRDPNSSSGIRWVLGMYDRAWGPERPVFGKIRFMSEANTRRKMRVDAYIERWNGGQATLGL